MATIRTVVDRHWKYLTFIFTLIVGIIINWTTLKADVSALKEVTAKIQIEQKEDRKDVKDSLRIIQADITKILLELGRIK